MPTAGLKKPVASYVCLTRGPTEGCAEHRKKLISSVQANLGLFLHTCFSFIYIIQMAQHKLDKELQFKEGTHTSN